MPQKDGPLAFTHFLLNYILSCREKGDGYYGVDILLYQ